jgi:hypothetical protein
MSTKAEDILNDIKVLPAEDLDQVRDGMAQLEERRRQWEEQRAKLRDMQSRHAGRGMLNALFKDRAKERARG